MTGREDQQPHISEDGGTPSGRFSDSDHLSDETLNALVDNRLSTSELEQAQTHLAACSTCRRNQRELMAITTLLRGLPQPVLRRSFQLSPEVAGRNASIWDRIAARLLPALPALRAGTVAVALLLVAVSARDLAIDSNGSDPMSEIPTVAIAAPTEVADLEEPSSLNTASLQTNQTESTFAPAPGEFETQADVGNPSGDVGFVATSADQAAVPAATDADSASKSGPADSIPMSGDNLDDEAAAANSGFAPESAGSAFPVEDASRNTGAAGGGSAGNDTFAMMVEASPTIRSTTTPVPTATPLPSPTATIALAATATPEPTPVPVASGSQTSDENGWRIVQIGLAIAFVVLLALVVLLHRLRGRRPGAAI